MVSRLTKPRKRLSKKTRIRITATFERRYLELPIEAQRAVWRTLKWIRKDPRPNQITRRKGALPGHEEVSTFVGGGFIVAAKVYSFRKRVRSGQQDVTHIEFLTLKAIR